MNSALMNLAERIRGELREIERMVQRAQTSWRQLRLTPDDAYLDSTTLNLRGSYEGLERLFSLILLTVDKKRLHGADWHQELLAQMEKDEPGIRPAVISAESRRALDKLRGFRHVVRHVYTFNYDPNK
jgi:protein subunit release factor A